MLRSAGADVPALLASFQLGNEGAAVLGVGGSWFATDVALDRGDVPPEVARVVDDGRVARQRHVIEGAGTYAVVGVPIAAVDASYFEFSSLDELERTLSTLALMLGVAAAGTTAAGAVVGHYASGRVLRPLRVMATTASGIAEGRLDERLDASGDADLAPLVASFNSMVDALRARIEREARFSSDVSHELRTPLAAMASALSVARRHATATESDALDVLAQKMSDFERLVNDLLEIGRLEAGVATLAPASTDPRDLARAAVATARADVAVEVDPSTPAAVWLDSRRVVHMLRNLIENAEHYGGGATAVRVWSTGGELFLAVDDAGPGVPVHERAYVFERFARGKVAVDRASGTGLGLALVAEHARLHAGRVWIDDSPDGGARFIVALPLVQP